MCESLFSTCLDKYMSLLRCAVLVLRCAVLCCVWLRSIIPAGLDTYWGHQLIPKPLYDGFVENCRDAPHFNVSGAICSSTSLPACLPACLPAACLYAAPCIAAL
jgi:hypothetical protein